MRKRCAFNFFQIRDSILARRDPLPIARCSLFPGAPGLVDAPPRYPRRDGVPKGAFRNLMARN